MLGWWTFIKSLNISILSTALLVCGVYLPSKSLSQSSLPSLLQAECTNIIPRLRYNAFPVLTGISLPLFFFSFLRISKFLLFYIYNNFVCEYSFSSSSQIYIFSYLVTLTIVTILIELVRTDILALFLILGESIQSITIQYDVSSRFVCILFIVNKFIAN